MTEPDMGSLHHHRGAAQQDDLVAPVELIGFAWSKTQRDISGCGRLPAFLAPAPGVTPHRIVTAVVPAAAQLLEDPDQRQLFTSRFSRVRRQQPVKLYCPSSQLWPRLHLPLVLERGLSRPQNLPNRVPRHLQVTGDLLDRLALDEVLAPDPGNSLHDQHPPPPALLRSRQRNRPTYRGSILDADPPALGVNIAGRMTSGLVAFLLVPLGAVIGWLLQRGILNRVVGADPLPSLIATFGLSIALQNLMLQIW